MEKQINAIYILKTQCCPNNNDKLLLEITKYRSLTLKSLKPERPKGRKIIWAGVFHTNSKMKAGVAYENVKKDILFRICEFKSNVHLLHKGYLSFNLQKLKELQLFVIINLKELNLQYNKVCSYRT